MNKRKLFMKALAVATAAALSMTPVTVYADGGVEIVALDQNETAVLGDVTDVERQDAVLVWADGHKADVTTGNLTSEDGNGLLTQAINNAEINVNVTGDIHATISSEDVFCGITVNSNSGSEQHINVNGNITSDGNGIGASADMSDISTGGSKNHIMVNGNITADDQGIEASASRGGKNHIEVTGDIKGDSKFDYNIGVISLMANDNGTRNDVFVKGNVTGNAIGVQMQESGRNQGDPVNNVVIDGILSAKEAAVLNMDYSDSGNARNTITVWKIETPGYTAAKWDDVLDENGEYDHSVLVEDKEAEKNIQYIIRVNQNDHAKLTATDEKGNALATVTGVGGSVLSYAHEGDNVLLKINVAGGYKVDAVYGDEGRKLQLIRDARGRYYITVPKNGGVSFSVELSADYSDDDDDELEYWITERKTVEAINAAPAGGSLTIPDMCQTGLSSTVVDAMMARRNVNFIFTYNVDGVTYRITVPAGYDLKPLLNGYGGINFAKLVETFGTSVVR